MCLADGMPVVWGASLVGMPIQERVAGADLVPRLVEASPVDRMAGPRVRFVVRQWPTVPRSCSPSGIPKRRSSIDPGPHIPDPTSVDDEVIDGIAAVDADILCVALGNPKQERFIDAHRDRLARPGDDRRRRFARHAGRGASSGHPSGCSEPERSGSLAWCKNRAGWAAAMPTT